MNAKNLWVTRVDEYLAFRRLQGFELRIDARQLRSFAEFADKSGEEHITLTLVTNWAQTSNRQARITWARRVEMLRGFIKFCSRDDLATELPPKGVFGASHRRRVPHIFSQEEFVTLLEQSLRLPSHVGMRPFTCHYVFGLLGCCGLRISEAIALTRGDVDFENGTLLVRDAKFHQQRLVPLHSSTTEALLAYSEVRDRLIRHPDNDHFFLADNGQPIKQAGMLYALHNIGKSLGWQPRGDYPNHRLHDLRHTFIVRAILRFYREGLNIDQHILSLSTYVGHANVSDTYWYMTGIPELMAVAAERFQRFSRGGLA